MLERVSRRGGKGSRATEGSEVKPPEELRRDGRLGATAQLLARELYWPVSSEDESPECWVPLEILDEKGEISGGIFYEAGLSHSAGYRALNKLKEHGYVDVIRRRTPNTRRVESTVRLFSSASHFRNRKSILPESEVSTSGIGSKHFRNRKSTLPESEVSTSGIGSKHFRNRKSTLPESEVRTSGSGSAIVKINLSKLSTDQPKGRVGGLVDNEPKDATGEIVTEVLRAVVAARTAAGWASPSGGYRADRDGVFILERLAAGASQETLLAAPWAASEEALRSVDQRVRSGRFVRPSTLYKEKNWERWIASAAEMWIAEKVTEKNKKVKREWRPPWEGDDRPPPSLEALEAAARRFGHEVG